MLTGKNVGHSHITCKGRKIQTLGQEQRGVRRNRPYQLVKLWGHEAPAEATPFQLEGRRSTPEKSWKAAQHRDDGEGEKRGFKNCSKTKKRELRKPDPIQDAGVSAGRRERNTNTGSRLELQGSQPETF